MVAMHIEDLRGAAKNGLKTIYIRRPDANEPIAEPEEVKSKKEGGEVDVVVGWALTEATEANDTEMTDALDTARTETTESWLMTGSNVRLAAIAANSRNGAGI